MPNLDNYFAELTQTLLRKPLFKLHTDEGDIPCSLSDITLASAEDIAHALDFLNTGNAPASFVSNILLPYLEAHVEPLPEALLPEVRRQAEEKLLGGNDLEGWLQNFQQNHEGDAAELQAVERYLSALDDLPELLRQRLAKQFHALELYQQSSALDFNVLPEKLKGKEVSAIVCYATHSDTLNLSSEIATAFAINQMLLFARRHRKSNARPPEPPVQASGQPIVLKDWAHYTEQLPDLFAKTCEPLRQIHEAFPTVARYAAAQIKADANPTTSREEVSDWLRTCLGDAFPPLLCRTTSLLFGKLLRHVGYELRISLRVHGKLPIRLVDGQPPELLRIIEESIGQAGPMDPEAHSGKRSLSGTDASAKRRKLDSEEEEGRTLMSPPESQLLFHLADCEGGQCRCMELGIAKLKRGDPIVLDAAEVLKDQWKRAVDGLLDICERNKKAYFRRKPATRGEEVRIISGGLHMQLHKDNEEAFQHYNNEVLPLLTRITAPLCLGAWDFPAADAALFSIQAYTASYLSNSTTASPKGQAPHTDLPARPQQANPFTVLISGAGGPATRYFPRPAELEKDQLGRLFTQYSVKEIVENHSRPFAPGGRYERYQIAIFSASETLHFAPPHLPQREQRRNFFQMAVPLGAKLDSYNGDNQNLPLSLLLDYLEGKYGSTVAIKHPYVFELICQSALDDYDPSTAWPEERKRIFQQILKAYKAEGGARNGSWKPSAALCLRWAKTWS